MNSEYADLKKKFTSFRKTVHISPKYKLIKAWIREHIKQGVFPAGYQFPSQTELPDICDASEMTVRRALNELQDEGLIVRERAKGTRVALPEEERILPNKNVHIGVVWPREVTPDYHRQGAIGQITEGIFSLLNIHKEKMKWTSPADTEPTQCTWSNQSGNIQVTCVGQANTSYEAHPPLETVEAQDFDGIISLSIVDDEWLEQLLDLKIPTVLVDYARTTFRDRADHIYVDPEPGYRQAVMKFHSNGFTRFHFVGCTILIHASTPDMDHKEWEEYSKGNVYVDPDSFLRLNTARQTLEENGLELEKDQIHFERFGERFCYELGTQLAKRPEKERPEVVICHSQNQADAIIECFANRELDLYGAGAGNSIPTSTALSIVIDQCELGKIAAETLISKLARPERPHFRVGVPMSFVDKEIKKMEPRKDKIQGGRQ